MSRDIVDEPASQLFLFWGAGFRVLGLGVGILFGLNDKMCCFPVCGGKRHFGDIRQNVCLFVLPRVGVRCRPILFVCLGCVRMSLG